MPKKPTRNNTRNRTPRTVQAASTLLRRVIQQAGPVISFDNQLPEAIRAGLPEVLVPHVLQVLQKAGELIIFVDSAAWAARLKLALAALELSGHSPIIVKVAPRGLAKR